MAPARKYELSQEEFLRNVQSAAAAPDRYNFVPQVAPLEDNPFFLWIIHWSIVRQIGPRMAFRRALATDAALFREWLRETPAEPMLLAEGMTAIEMVGPKDVPSIDRKMKPGQVVLFMVVGIAYLLFVAHDFIQTFGASRGVSGPPIGPSLDQLVHFLFDPFSMLNWVVMILLGWWLLRHFRGMARASRAHSASVRARVKLCSIKGLMSQRLARKFAGEMGSGCVAGLVIIGALIASIYAGHLVFLMLYFLDGDLEWARYLWSIVLPLALFFFLSGTLAMKAQAAEAAKGLARLAELLEVLKLEQRQE